MHEFAYLFLYGMLALTGLFLTAVWGELAVRRYRRLHGKGVRHDRYFWLCLGLCVNAVGSVALFGVRGLTSARSGLSPHHLTWEGSFILAALATILLGKTMMVWLADLEKDHPRFLWGMVAFSVAWSIFSYWTVF